MPVSAWRKTVDAAGGRGETESRARVVLVALLLATVSYAIPSLLLSWIPKTLVDVVAVGCVGVFTLVALAKGLRFFLTFWVFLATLQNFFVGFFSFGISSDIPIVVTEQKTVALVVAFTLASPLMFRWLKLHRTLALLITGYLVLVLVNLRSVDSAVAAYGRNFLLPVLALVFVLSAAEKLSGEQRRNTLMDIFRTLAVALTAGVLLELAIGTERWRSLLHAEFNGGLNSLSRGTNVFGIRVPRVGGLIVEPTNLGYVAAALLLIFVLVNYGSLRRLSRYDWLCAFLVLSVLALSGAKSGFLMLAVGIVVAVLAFKYNTPRVALAISWIFSFLLIATYVGKVKGFSELARAFGDPIPLVGGDSTTFHLVGLIFGIREGFATPFGHGLGEGGNFNRVASESWLEWLGTGSESAWGVLAYQMGIVGLVLFLAISMAIAAIAGGRSAVLLGAWLSAALFAEAMFGPQVAGILCIAAGLLADSNGQLLGPGSSLNSDGKHATPDGEAKS
ncbi:hypothetical protein HQO83_03025 [Rhodococcus fascians]|nr:hypothetical protein [Rhodococcus fascians]